MTTGPGAMRRAWVAVVGVAMLGISACGVTVTPTGTPSPSPSPGDATTAVYQQRSDIALERVAVQVRNTSAEALEIIAARVESSSFVEPLVWDGDGRATLRPGGAVDLRAQLTVPDCDVTIDRSVVVLTYRLGDATAPQEATLTPDPTFDALQRLHDEACLRRAVEQVAVVTAEEVIFDGGPGASGVLRISIAPTGSSATVQLHSVSSTTLIMPLTPGGTGTDEFPVDATIGVDGPLELRIPIKTSRCDVHAMAEDKVGTLIPVHVTLEDGTSGRFVLPARPDFRAQVFAFFTAYCGLG